MGKFHCEKIHSHTAHMPFFFFFFIFLFFFYYYLIFIAFMACEEALLNNRQLKQGAC